MEIRKLIKTASQKLLIVDPYVDHTLFVLLSANMAQDLSVQILTKSPSPDFFLEAEKWQKQHSGASLDIRLSKDFHDRFVVVDDKCWHLGCSIKDAGNKAFMLAEIEDHGIRLAILDKIQLSWESGQISSRDGVAVQSERRRVEG